MRGYITVETGCYSNEGICYSSEVRYSIREYVKTVTGSILQQLGEVCYNS
jgi:hypothetical protein